MKIERIFEPSRVRRGRLATSPVYYVSAPDGTQHRFTLRREAQAFINGYASGAALQRFAHGQRVIVVRDNEGNEINAPGRVKRLRRGDDGAWIALDARHPNARHPFPETDDRGTHVLAYPEDCKAPPAAQGAA